MESAATLVSSLPREDLTKHIMVGFMGTRSVYKVVKEMAKRLRPLSLNPKHVFMWLHFLKQVENPYYVNINIPGTEKKKGIAQENCSKTLLRFMMLVMFAVVQLFFSLLKHRGLS